MGGSAPGAEYRPERTISSCSLRRTAAALILALLLLELKLGIVLNNTTGKIITLFDTGRDQVALPRQNVTFKEGNATVSPVSHEPSIASAQWSNKWPPDEARPVLSPSGDETPPTEYNMTRVVLFWNKFYESADFYVGAFGSRAFAGCAVDNCVTTADKSALPRAHAVVTHMHNPILPPLPIQRPAHQHYIFFLREPPTMGPVNIRAHNGVYNLTMTYRADSDIVDEYLGVAEGAERLVVPAPELRNRTVAWIVSHCQTSSARELYVQDLQSYIDVDVYGKCGRTACNTSQGVERHLCYQSIAAHYHFYLALENSECRDYITEKPLLALQYGMVPVVLGARREQYEQALPPHSFIHVEDFTGPGQLAQYLRYLLGNRTAYAAYFSWRERYHMTTAKGWCRLCEYLHRPHVPQWYDDIERWWHIGSQCAQKPIVEVEYYDSK